LRSCDLCGSPLSAGRCPNPQCPLSDAMNFVDPEGSIGRRFRSRGDTRPPIDLETADKRTIRQFIDLRKGRTMTLFAQAIFPDRPLRYTLAARLLLAMAFRKLTGGMTPREWEAKYARLPKYAQWRRYWNHPEGIDPIRDSRRNAHKLLRRTE
jgi:hypothetical protein